MNKLINLAKKLNLALKESEISKEYFSIKDAISKDDYLMGLLNSIKQSQNEDKECLKQNDLKNYKIKAKTLEVLKDEFINHPLINNYIVAKEEMENMLFQVVNILSEE